MIKRILIILFFAGLISCNQHRVTIPDDVLNEKKMTAVLSDLHIAQLELNERMRSDKKDVTADDYFEVILKRNKITRKEFLTSLKFYSANPDLLNVMYDSVVVQLNRKQQ